jgi:hypothetical protein
VREWLRFVGAALLFLTIGGAFIALVIAALVSAMAGRYVYLAMAFVGLALVLGTYLFVINKILGQS